MPFKKNEKNKNKNKKKKKLLNVKVSSIDLKKDIPQYVTPKKKDKIKEFKIDDKINTYATRKNLLTTETKLLRSNFDEFYNRTVDLNSKYFDPSLLYLIDILKDNIDGLEVSSDFSNSFLKHFNKLKTICKESKRYIKKIDSAFKEASKYLKIDPTSKSTSYKIKSLIDLESVSGDELAKVKQDLQYLISNAAELKYKISYYHPLIREKENLSLAKSCEYSWKICIEACRELKPLLDKIAPPAADDKPMQNKKQSKDNIAPSQVIKFPEKWDKQFLEKNNPEVITKISLLAQTIHESRDNYTSAFEDLKISLHNQKTITPEDLPKELQKKLENFFKSWDEKKKDIKKFDNIQYESSSVANVKKKLKGGLEFFHNTIDKIRGVRSDWRESMSILSELGWT